MSQSVLWSYLVKVNLKMYHFFLFVLWDFEYCGHYWPIVPAPDDREICGMKIGRGNGSTRKKSCPSATLSTTNPTRLDPILNPGRRGGKAATNRLSYGAAFKDLSS
jgi:hypothetical protein